MQSYWLKNKETNRTLFISEKQLSAFGIDLSKIGAEDYDWEFTDSNVKTNQKKQNKELNKELIVLEKNGSCIRAAEKQLPQFLSNGWRVCSDQSKATPKETTITEEKAAAEDEEEISDEEITNFLASVDGDDDDLWNQNGEIAQSTLDDRYGKSKVTKAKVQEIWEGFSRKTLTE
jgi:hypothetical protein